MSEIEYKIKNATNLYTFDIIEMVVHLVTISDKDRVWDLLNERKMHEHIACLEYIYF